MTKKLALNSAKKLLMNAVYTVVLKSKKEIPQNEKVSEFAENKSPQPMNMCLQQKIKVQIAMWIKPLGAGRKGELYSQAET